MDRDHSSPGIESVLHRSRSVTVEVSKDGHVAQETIRRYDRLLDSGHNSRISVRVLQVDDRPFTSAISQRVPAVCSAHKDQGDRSFAVSGPLAWNSLPVALRSSDVTEETFRRHLKTFLFNCLDN